MSWQVDLIEECRKQMKAIRSEDGPVVTAYWDGILYGLNYALHSIKREEKKRAKNKRRGRG